MGITDAFKAIDTIGNTIDDNIESRQEAEDTRTERLRIDMTSDNKLSKLIRPLITIYSGILFGALSILDIWFEIDENTIYATGLTFGTCIGFYFNSKRQERVIEKKSNAAIQIEKLKARDGIKENRHNRRMERKNK